MATKTTAMARAAAMGAAVLLLGGTVAGAAPREQPPQAPPERTQVIAFDLDAFAGSIADLPDPLPAPPTDGSIESCQEVGARPAVYPLFDGQTLTVPARAHAKLCAVQGASGPLWTLSWSGAIQDPAVPGTGGLQAYGLWTLIGSEQGWVAGMGNLIEGAQFDYRPADWGGGDEPATQLVIEGRYLDRSTFPYEPPPPLQVEQTSTTAVVAAPQPTGTAPPAQPVRGAPGYTG